MAMLNLLSAKQHDLKTGQSLIMHNNIYTTYPCSQYALVDEVPHNINFKSERFELPDDLRAPSYSHSMRYEWTFTAAGVFLIRVISNDRYKGARLNEIKVVVTE
jgi:hypothetical protein